MKQVIKLTESDLNNMVYKATKEYINLLVEITTKQAAIAGGSNAAAFRDYATTHSPNSKQKMDRADLIRLPLITKAITDKFGNFKIELVEQNENNHMTYVNFFVFDCVVLIDDNSCVMKGEISIGGRPYSIGFIRYLFEEDKWERVRCGAAMRVTTISQLEPFHANLTVVNKITSFLREFIELEEKNRETANKGPIITSKPRKPLTSRAKHNLYGQYISAYKKNRPIMPTEDL